LPQFQQEGILGSDARASITIASRGFVANGAARHRH
jgi:hypothetical protein